MDDTQIRLSGIWIALMLTYLLGDVIRIFSGDFVSGEIEGVKATQAQWMLIAVIMLIPIAMIVLTMLLNQPVNRWVNMIAAGLLFVFNVIGLPTYPSLYDKFLIVVGLILNVLTVVFAWNWSLPAQNT